jgi:chitosanase
MRARTSLVAAALSVALTAPAAASTGGNLASPAKKEIAMQLVSSAENSSLDWRDQYDYIEDIGDGRGYTAGIIGFCSGTGDMLEVVQAYTRAQPGNPLARFLPALRKVNGTDSHEGLGKPFVRAWKQAARTRGLQKAQENERDRVYFNPSVKLAKSDELGALGQFAYYDAAVVHGFSGLKSIRRRTLKNLNPPSRGEKETIWLDGFLDQRVVEMKKEAAHENVDRIEKAQRKFLREGNLALDPPLKWVVYGDHYTIGR